MATAREPKRFFPQARDHGVGLNRPQSKARKLMVQRPVTATRVEMVPPEVGAITSPLRTNIHAEVPVRQQGAGKGNETRQESAPSSLLSPPRAKGITVRGRGVTGVPSRQILQENLRTAKASLPYHDHLPPFPRNQQTRRRHRRLRRATSTARRARPRLAALPLLEPTHHLTPQVIATSAQNTPLCRLDPSTKNLRAVLEVTLLQMLPLPGAAGGPAALLAQGPSSSSCLDRRASCTTAGSKPLPRPPEKRAPFEYRQP